MTRVTRLSIITGLVLLAGLAGWFFTAPLPSPTPVFSRHSYTEALQAARRGDAGAARLLYQQLGRTDLAPEARVVLLASLPDYPSDRALALARTALHAVEPAVRRMALQALAGLLPAEQQADELGPLLDDEDDSLRNAAAQVLMALPTTVQGPYGARVRKVLDDHARSLQAKPADIDAQLQLAALRLREGDAQGADAAARRVLALRPDTLQARVLLAKALDRQGKPDSARATLAEPLRAQPDNPFLQHELGLWLRDHGQATYALLALARAVELDPGNATYRMDLAASLHDLDQPAAAQAQLDQLVRRQPANRKARLLLVQYWKETGQLQNVQVLLAELEQQNADDPFLDEGL